MNCTKVYHASSGKKLVDKYSFIILKYITHTYDAIYFTYKQNRTIYRRANMNRISFISVVLKSVTISRMAPLFPKENYPKYTSYTWNISNSHLNIRFSIVHTHTLLQKTLKSNNTLISPKTTIRNEHTHTNENLHSTNTQVYKLRVTLFR